MLIIDLQNYGISLLRAFYIARYKLLVRRSFPQKKTSGQIVKKN